MYVGVSVTALEGRPGDAEDVRRLAIVPAVDTATSTATGDSRTVHR